MIALDTNVISELMHDAPNPRVLAWMSRQSGEALYLPSVVLAELLYGIAILPAGKQKNAKEKALAGLLPLFEGRILPLDAEAARCFAALAAKGRGAGQTMGQNDAYIAAIAQVSGCAVATRDVRPFLTAGVPVINPWE